MDNMYTTMGKPAEEALPLKQKNLKIQDDAFSKWTCNIAYVLRYLFWRKLLIPCLIYVVHLYILYFHRYIYIYMDFHLALPYSTKLGVIILSPTAMF